MEYKPRIYEEQLMHSCIQFAGRWGFLTRNLFSKYFCNKQRSQQLDYWSRLIKTGYFSRSEYDGNVLILSPKGKSRCAVQARPARFFQYIKHDEMVAEVTLAFSRKGLVERFWLEDELFRNHLMAFQVLGANKITRVPDMIFELRPEYQKLRFAVEIEKTRKAKSRYDKIAMAYCDLHNIDLVIFGCIDLATEDCIENSFKGIESHPARTKAAFFQVLEFVEEGFSCRIRVDGKEISFSDLFNVSNEAVTLNVQNAG